MDNKNGTVGGQKEDHDFSSGKDFLNKGDKKKKPLRREKDAIRKITRECMKDWRGIDFDEDEI
jgi:hypothetical protein